MFPFELAKLMHEERLRNAEKARLHQRDAQVAPPFKDRLLDKLWNPFGNRLIAYRARQARAHLPLHSLKLKGAREK